MSNEPQTDPLALLTAAKTAVQDMQTEHAAALAAGKARENALDDVKDNYRDVVVPELVQQVKTLNVEVVRLKKLQAADSGGSVGKTERVRYEIIPDFDPEKHLTAPERKIRTGIYEWLDILWENYWSHIERGFMPPSSANYKTGVPLIDGTMHQMVMRDAGHYSSACRLLLLHWGDPEALKRLQRLNRVIYAEKTMATGYGPKAEPRMVVYKGDASNYERLTGRKLERDAQGRVSDEQPGLLRFNFQLTGNIAEEFAATGKVVNYVDTDARRELDSDLECATLAGNELAFFDNREHGAQAEYDRLKLVSEHKRERLRFWAEISLPGKPWYVFGKSLRHPSIARHLAHSAWHLLYKDPAEKEAADWYGTKLKEDVDIIDVGGVKVHLVPHYPQALQKARGQPQKGGAGQDATYLRESAPHELELFLLGSPHITADYLEVAANNLHKIVLFNGPGGGVPATIAGHGSRDKNGQKGVLYQGKVVGPSRWSIDRADQPEGSQVASRGLHSIYSAWGSEPEQYQRDLEELDALPDSTKYGRHGARVSLMFFERKERIEK